MHLLQKEMMGRYFERLTRAAEQGEGKAVYMLISGNPVELVQAFDLLPVYPEIDALQLAVKKSALPFIQKAEELGYSMDNCAYVKADVGLFLGDRKTPFATIPLPTLILCNYVGCNVYLQWFEHLAEYCHGELYNLDIPFLRDPSGQPSAQDITYVVRQLEEVIETCERITGKKLDYARLKAIVGRSGETGEMWSRIKALTKTVPSPFDAYFDSVTMMAPLYCLRGTEEGVRFFETALKEMEEKVEAGTGQRRDDAPDAGERGEYGNAEDQAGHDPAQHRQEEDRGQQEHGEEHGDPNAESAFAPAPDAHGHQLRHHAEPSSSDNACSAVISPRRSRSMTSARDGAGSVSTKSSA